MQRRGCPRQAARTAQLRLNSTETRRAPWWAPDHDIADLPIINPTFSVGKNTVDESLRTRFMFGIARRTTIRVGASRKPRQPPFSRQGVPMNAQELLQEIADYC